MADIIFNELSLDFSYSTAPKNESEALYILKNFVDNCLAFSLASGNKIFVREYSNISRTSVNLLNTSLWSNDNIYTLLKKLEKQDVLTGDEILRFKQMMAEISIINVNPEYEYESKEVFGLAKAVEEEKYIVSLATHDHWKLNLISNIIQIQLGVKISENVCSDVKNISCLSHIFEDHKVWNKCVFKHDRLKKNFLLPNFKLSEYIPKAFSYVGWHDYYTKQQGINPSEKIKIGNIVAIINGWKASSACPNQKRALFEAKKYFIAIDTQHSTFEVYSGKTDHLGELFFNNNAINTSKKDKTRGACGRNTD